MASEPAEPTTRQEELINKAHAAVDWAAAFKASLPEPGAKSGHISFRARSVLRQLADAGLLADPAQTTELPRLAELAEQAGKLRTAEWLCTCALLPPEEWPPAPAYKGPMVPATDLDIARAETQRLADACREYEAQIVEWREEAETGGDGWGMFRTRQALGTPDGRAVSTHAAEVRAERDALQARIDAALALMDYWEIPQGHRLRAALQGDQPAGGDE